MVTYLKQFIWGFAFGVANIIPGVSGGTFALVLGFYGRLISAIEGVNARSVSEFIEITKKFPQNFTGAQDELKEWCREKDVLFLLFLGIGSVVAIFSLSSLMSYLLVSQFAPTYGYFFGLILLSVAVPWRLIKKKSFMVLLCVFIGAGLTVGVTIGVDPVAKAESKSVNYKERLEAQAPGSHPSVNDREGRSRADLSQVEKLTWTSKYTKGEILMAAVSGAIAISAMVLPGISGSLILILLGQYMMVIQAVSNLKNLLLDDIVFLAVMSLGMLVGLVMTARVVKWALATIHDQTMGFLTGLILGSLFVLWPFREVAVRDLYVKTQGVIVFEKGVKIYTNSILAPTMNVAGAIALFMILLGVFSMVFFLKNDPEA